MSRLILLAILATGLAFAMPDPTQATTFNEVKKLTASDAEADDLFGQSVAVSGETAIVGAYHEDTEGDNAGAAYIYQRDEGGVGAWGEVTKLTASNAQAFDRFGRSVAVSGDTAIAGAMGEDAGGADAGAAYIFQRDEGGADNWGEVKKLIASDAEADDFFGFRVAVAGDTAVVAALHNFGAGVVYVFQRDQGGLGNWGEVKKLTASDANSGFARSLAVSGSTAVVGADTGAAYVFQRDEGGANNWGEVKKLTASDAEFGDLFGFSVAVSGDTAVVGAYHEDAGGANAGAAYVFRRDQGGMNNWGEVKKLIASNAGFGDLFGFSVAVSGDTAVISAVSEDAGGAAAGAAYVFRRDLGGTNSWGEEKKLTASDSEPGDFFGSRVAISGNTAFVGAWGEDAGGDNAGAAYVFDLQEAKATPTVTPTPTPTRPVGVGGIALGGDLRPLPLETAADRDGSRWVVITATLAASSLAAGGAAWYTRRRWLA